MPETPCLSLRLLGPLDLGSIKLPTRKSEILLSYLALSPGRPHRRDSLMGLLWEDRAEKQARHSLSQTLFSIRKALGDAGSDCLEVDGDTVTLLAHRASIDALDFERLAGSGDRGSLAAAAALYRGDLLEGINLREIAVQDWLATERTRYKELALATLARLAAFREQEGDLDGAVHDAVRLVSLDPLQESAHRMLMRLYAAQDRPAAALRQYERLAAILKRELDEEPEAATRQLHAEIGRRRRSSPPVPANIPENSAPSPPPATAAAAPVVPAPPTCSAPIGRDDDLAKLEVWLGEARGGRRRVVFVTGEAGLGKTTLLDVLLARAAEAGVMVGRGQCIEHRGAGEPFMPLIEALGELCRTASEMRAALETHAPSWAAQLPGLSGRPQSGVGTRERLLRELLDALEAATAVRPLLVVVEDLHWSDASTLDLIDALARRRGAARLMVLASCRDSDSLSAGSGVVDLIRGLTFRNLGSLLPLAPLDEGAVERCLAERFPGARPPRGLASALVRRGGGNPLFMLNLLDWWIDRGLLVHAGETLHLPSAAALEQGVPESLGFLIRKQLDGLDRQEREIVECASVAGDTVPAALVAAALQTGEEAVETVLAGLSRRGLLVRAAGQITWPDGTVTAQFAFLHQLYRECIYEHLTPTSRRRLHEEIGRRLEQAYGSAASLPAGELALHFVEARDAGRAVRYLETAIEQALGRSAHCVAVGLLDRALRLLPALGPRQRIETEIRLQSLRAPVLVATRGWLDPEAETALRRACDLSRELQDGSTLSSAILGLASLFEVRGEYRTTQDLLKERSSLPEARCDSPASVYACELMTCSLFHSARFGEAVVEADQAIAGYVASRDVNVVAFFGENPVVSCHSWAGRALWFLGRPEEAAERLHAASRAADDADHYFAKALAHEQMARLDEHRDRPAAALAHAQRAIELGEEFGFPYRVASGRVLRGWARAALGETESGIAEIELGLSACRELGAMIEYPYYLALLAKAHEAAGRPEAGLALLEEALALAQSRQGFFYEAEILRLIGRMRTAGDEAAAEEALRIALSVARTRGEIATETRAAADLARLWLSRGRTAEAWRLLEDLSPVLHQRSPSPAVADALELLERASRAAPLPVQRLRFCSAPDGARIAYSMVGRGLPLVKAGNWLTHLEHDWQSPIWRPLFEELARAMCLVRYDPRGTGLSDWTPPEISFERWVDDLEAVVDATGLQRFALLGMSQGAAVSIAYAARHPERVSRLILLGGYSRGRLRRGDPFAADYEHALNTLIRAGWGQENGAFRQMFSALYLPEATAEQIRWFTELERLSTTPETAVRVRETCSTCDVSALMPDLRIPTLVLHARRDAVVPFEEGRLIAASIPDARFVPLDSCNHMLLPHEPAWSQALHEILNFVAEQPVPLPAPARAEPWPRTPSPSAGRVPGAAA